MSEVNPRTSPFVDRLGEHLHRAAVQRFEPRRSHGRPLVFAATGAITLGCVIALIMLWPGSERAEAFVIGASNDRVHVEVVDFITDPVAAGQQLEFAGLRVTLTAIPVSDELIGRLIAVSTPNDLAIVTERTSRGITRFEIAVGSSIELEYGRKAADGERFQATASSAQCSSWRGRLVEEIQPEIESEILVVRWQVFDPDAGRIDEVSELPVGNYVQDVIGLDATSAVIVVAKTKNALPPTGDC